MMRQSQIIAKKKEENLGYMSDMAIELARMAKDSGLTTLAYLFGMAALEASTGGTMTANRDEFRQRMMPH